MPFGQLIIGPPGSGKSTYSHGMLQFLSAIGRKTSIINLDPANDHLDYPCALDIRDFSRLEEIMEEENLGPNGGVMFAMEEIEQAMDDFVAQIEAIGQSDYLLFDCPGQVELFTHHSALSKVFKRLQKQLDIRLVVVNLIDCFYITSPSQYISVVLMALRSMLLLDLPHINVLSKVDLLKSYGELPFGLEFYTQVQDLSYLFPHIEAESSSTLGKKYSKLTEAIAEMVEEYGLVQFEVLAVEDKKSMISLLTVIDKANGYLFGSTEVGGDTVWAEATRQGGYLGSIADIQERWIDEKEIYDDAERKEMEQIIESEKEKNSGEPLDEWELSYKQWEEEMASKGPVDGGVKVTRKPKK